MRKEEYTMKTEIKTKRLTLCPMSDAEIEALIEKRQEARKARDFKLADEIRDQLLARGIILEDTREGVKWKRA